MTWTLSQILFGYVAVFLALIFASWFVFSWRRHRSEVRARRYFICNFCAGKIPEAEPALKLRCPGCGAVQERRVLRPEEK
jgi:predicted RNA-binding Zn-ribbon protein involved in translation (DUF1610 family)